MTHPHPIRTKEQVLKDFRTGEILDAARRVIGELGYAEASMERIAQAAGVAKGTLYLYFKNKESLLSAAFELGHAELMGRTRACTQRARGAKAKLREIARAFVEHCAEHQAFYRALLEQPALGPDGFAGSAGRARELVDEYIRYLAGSVERGIRAGELRGVDPERAARALVEILRGVVALRLREPDPTELTEDVDTAMDLFLHGVDAGEPK